MILAIDIGNTHIVVGGVKEERVVFSERLTTGAHTELEYVMSLKALLDLYGERVEKVEGSIIASVVPKETGVVRRAIEKLTGKKALLVGPGVKTGLNIVTDNPAQVGADMIVSAVAGLKYYGAPLVIIDMGTATTFSVLDNSSRFIGTVIMPGVRTSLDALAASTAQLPGISIEAPRKVVGRNTVDSMKSGIVFGEAACIDGLIDRIEEETGFDVTVVATGGAAESIIMHCRRTIIYDSELTLKGLSIIYQRNSGF